MAAKHTGFYHDDDGQDGRRGQSENAPNGEGKLGPPDDAWRPTKKLGAGPLCVALAVEQVGLRQAIAESIYVSDVFFAMEYLPLERCEAFLAALGHCQAPYQKLRCKCIGTLAGDFIRWCRGLFPGLLAHDLAAVLAASGLTLAGQYEAEIRQKVARADRFFGSSDEKNQGAAND